MLYLLYKTSLFLLRLVNIKTAHSIVSFCAKVKYIFSGREKKLVKGNLRAAIPELKDARASRLAMEVFENFGRYLVAFFGLIKGEKDYLKKSIRLVGLENLDEALSAGRGCIIMTGHFGNWELTGCATANQGYKVNAIVLDHADRRINDFFIKRRENVGINIIHAGNAGAECRKALARGESIAIVCDRPFGDRGMEVDFFGKKALFPRGGALMSVKNNAPIVMCFSYREKDEQNVYTACFEKPIFPKQEGPLKERMIELIQKFVGRFEYYIRRYPSQWYMFNRIWDQDRGKI